MKTVITGRRCQRGLPHGIYAFEFRLFHRRPAYGITAEPARAEAV